jgi:hypothetical protein
LGDVPGAQKAVQLLVAGAFLLIGVFHAGCNMRFINEYGNRVSEGLVGPYPLILHRLHPPIRRKSEAEITKGACGKPGVFFWHTLRDQAANQDETCPGLLHEKVKSGWDHREFSGSSEKRHRDIYCRAEEHCCGRIEEPNRRNPP